MSEEVGEVERELRGMLYGGERLGEVIAFETAGVAVTSHRVLVLEPGGEPRYREVALPNVTDAGPDTDGDTGVALQALRRGVYAVALFGASLLFDFQSLASDLLGTTEVPSAQGVGEVVSIVRSIVSLFGLVDDLLGLVGLAFALIALVHAVRYARSRSRMLELSVSGSDPIRVPIERREIEVARRAGDAIEHAKEALGNPQGSSPADG